MTVCYPWRKFRGSGKSFKKQILLGLHNDTPGAQRLCMVDKYNGPGGKFKPDEDPTIEACAGREVEEEFGIRPDAGSITRAGIIEVDNCGFRAYIHFFFTNSWKGTIAQESREFRDIRWHDTDHLPYENMMDADRVFQLPLLLFEAMERGEIMYGAIAHDHRMKVIGLTREFTYHKMV